MCRALMIGRRGPPALCGQLRRSGSVDETVRDLSGRARAVNSRRAARARSRGATEVVMNKDPSSFTAVG